MILYKTTERSTIFRDKILILCSYWERQRGRELRKKRVGEMEAGKRRERGWKAKVREIKKKDKKRKGREMKGGKRKEIKDYGTETRERLTNKISLRACKLSLREISIYFISIKVSIVSLTISIMQPQCLLT